MKKTRLASILLLSAVILSVLASCGSGSGNEAVNETTVTAGDTIAETEVTTSM
ncbi:MAG: hypothetical protein GX827_01315 [Clostridiales bacterium]|nr:hypothetical protein [Clostridiales bacterium]